MNRRKDTMDIRELLRQCRAGQSDRAIHRSLKIHRQTVARYRAWAEEHHLLTGDLPPVEELQRLLETTLPDAPPPQNTSTVEPYRDLVVRWRAENVEVAAIHQRLQEPRLPDATVRVERSPGEEAQVDFGYAGKMLDPLTGKLRRSWGFVMTLSWSRHQYVEFVFDQKAATWLSCHRHAFEFLGGVPQRVVIDNLKAAILRACQEEPQVQQGYRECAEHYGFLIAPCRVHTPQHKGKVEQGGVHYVQRNFLGGREPTTLTQANRDVRAWCLTTAGERIHGTTREQPLRRFQETEQAALQPLPTQPYDIGEWKLLKLHRDCHVVFEHSYYSAPFPYIGQRLRVRGGLRTVTIYSLDYQLIASHDRAQQPGTRFTHPDHLPDEKVPGWRLNRDSCREQARAIGAATSAVVQKLLDDPAVDRLAMAGRLLRLRQAFGDARLETACQRALHFGDPTYRTVKRILTLELDRQPLPEPAAPPPARTFVRGVAELVGNVLGGLSWS
jgi:transposase